jgi:hypothetical protein
VVILATAVGFDVADEPLVCSLKIAALKPAAPPPMAGTRNSGLVSFELDATEVSGTALVAMATGAVVGSAEGVELEAEVFASDATMLSVDLSGCALANAGEDTAALPVCLRSASRFTTETLEPGMSLKSSAPESKTTFGFAPKPASLTDEFGPSLTRLPSWKKRTAGPAVVATVSPTTSGKEVTPGVLTGWPSSVNGTALVTVAIDGAADAQITRALEQIASKNARFVKVQEKVISDYTPGRADYSSLDRYDEV